MIPPDFGLESLYRLQAIDSRKDALILLVHFVLSKNGWRFVGRGTVWTDGEEDRGTESLPAGWQNTGTAYRYVSQSEKGKKFVVKFVDHEMFLLVSMVSVADEHAVSMNVNMTEHVDAEQLASNDTKKVYPKLLELLNSIHSQLVVPCSVDVRSVGTSTSTPSTTNPVHQPYRGGGSYPPEMPATPGIPQIGGMAPTISTGPPVLPLGRRDLDPFAGPGVGGGMLADPLRVGPRRDPGIGPYGPLQPGAIPPGARFDPYGPVGPLGGPGMDPDNDMFVPPGLRGGPRSGGPRGGPPFGGAGPFGGGGHFGGAGGGFI